MMGWAITKKYDGYQVAKKIAAEDEMGKALQDLSFKKRERASQKNKVWKDLSIYWFWLAKEIRTDWRAKLWIFSMLGYRRIAFYVCISNTMIISEVMVFFWLPREWILPSTYDMQIVKKASEYIDQLLF